MSKDEISIELELSSHYSDPDKWSIEPVVYECLDRVFCKHKIETPAGYYLQCIRCCEKDLKE